MSDELRALGARLGDRYLIERELGRGGMGAVYLARDRRLDRPVALKVLPPEFAVVPELRERFLRETRLAAGFSHPNIVPVFAIEETDEVLAFAMGFVEGESLAARVAREGPLAARDAVRLMTDVGYALAYAHGRGVVHRDIKPDNIMIERATGRALVMDFGIARAITPVADKPGLTRVGEVVGTPEYMSPEQAAGEAVDGRADLYSLGLVLWFALTGRTAVTGESTQRILVKQLTEDVPPLASERADLPAALCDVVDRCCAKESGDRFDNAEALVEALDAAQLASPEIPVAIRLLAPELSMVGTRGLSAIGMILLGGGMVASNGNGNVLAIGVIVAAMAWVGLLGALREVRRLRGIGYGVDEIQHLLRQTLAEKDEERARRATDTRLVQRRRIRTIIAWVLLVWQVIVLVKLRFDAGGSNIKLTGNVALVGFLASLLGTAAAIAVLLASPFRRSLPERLFNATWLGGVGRRVFAVVTRGSAVVPVGAGSRTGVRTRPTPLAVPAPASAQQPPAPRVTPTAPTPRATGRTLETLADDVEALRVRMDALEAQRGR